MSSSLERELLGSVLNTYAQANNLAVHWPNRDFEPPTKANWVRFTIRSGDAKQIEFGSVQNTNRYPGVLMLQVFSPANSGDKAAKVLAENLAALYRKTVLGFVDGQIRLRVPTVREIGEDGSWYQVNVVIPFDRDNLQ